MARSPRLEPAEIFGHGARGVLHECADSVAVALSQIYVRHGHAERPDGLAVWQVDGRTEAQDVGPKLACVEAVAAQPGCGHVLVECLGIGDGRSVYG